MRKIYLLAASLILSLSLNAQDLYDVNNIREVRLTFKQDNWADILGRFKDAGKDQRLTATVTVDGVRYEEVGVRHKGNSSYYNVKKTGSSKLPFNIKANYKRKGQKFKGGFESLKLSNIFRDPSFLREVLAYEIAGKYMPSPRANFVRLYANDQFLGLYNSTESVDEKFLMENFGSNNGTLFKCDPDWHGSTPPGCKKGQNGSLNYLGKDSVCYYDFYELKSKHGWGDLMELAKNLEENTNGIEKYLNVDRALWMLAYNNVLVNLDSYTGRLCHNYYIYKDRSGQFNTIPWDMNMNFGGFRFLDNKGILNTEKLQRMSVLTNFKAANRPLINKLLGNSMYRKIYIAHVRTILKENFSNGWYEKRAKEIQGIIDAEVQKDDNKLYAYEDFKKNLVATTKAGKTPIIGITELMKPRIEYLEAHPLLNKVPPAISNVEHSTFSDDATITAKIDGVRKAFVFYRKKGANKFTRLALNDKGENGDSNPGDGTYAAIIPRNGEMEYYIMALNADAAMFSPERAAFETHIVK